MVDDTNEHAVKTVSHNEYKDILLYQICLKDSINRIQSKNHRIGTYEINKISLSCLMINYVSKTMDMNGY